MDDHARNIPDEARHSHGSDLPPWVPINLSASKMCQKCTSLVKRTNYLSQVPSNAGLGTPRICRGGRRASQETHDVNFTSCSACALHLLRV